MSTAASIRSITSIIQSFPESKLVVVSAMGKTTDRLERIVAQSKQKRDFTQELSAIKEYHVAIVNELFSSPDKILGEIAILFQQIERDAAQPDEYDLVYDQVVSMGEVISSVIVSNYLIAVGVDTRWLDARNFIATDATYREGKVDWQLTKQKVESANLLNEPKAIITQGFIGSNFTGNTTTLGREGSDFSAAIFASCLGAKSVTIWKDVAGVMNADPKKILSAKVFEELPYHEAAEMTYYGASIIHPKTIKPLANKGIPLFVKSFLNPSLAGTVIHDCRVDKLPTLIVFKENQCLISCKVTDYSFINEEQLGVIFKTLSESNVKINVMQNSAISLSFCVDFREDKILKLIEQLSTQFEVYYNTKLTLITIKNYDLKTCDEYRNKPGVILEQSSRSTLQLLIKA